MRTRTAFAPLFTLCLALFACKLMKPSPEKLCDKAEKLLAEEGTSKSGTQKSKCTAELKKMKADNPERYECVSKCVDSSKDGPTLGVCMTGCGSESGSATASKSDDDDDSTKTYPVDSLTSSDVSSKISSAYQYYGYDITNEKSNAAGWSATVALGKKGPRGEVHIYKVLLVTVSGRKDGFTTAEKLKNGSGAVETRVGNKQLLFVQCLYQRSSTESGVPKECGSYDSKISSFTDDIAKY